MKFAGDALLAFWPCSKYEAVKTVQHVIRMCLGLQSTLDKYQTVDGVVLRMKLGVSVGPMEMYHIGESTMYDYNNYVYMEIMYVIVSISLIYVILVVIGNELYKMFDLAGEAVDDVNKAQSLAKSGSVVISPPAWDTCNKPYCFANLLADGYIQVCVCGWVWVWVWVWVHVGVGACGCVAREVQLQIWTAQCPRSIKVAMYIRLYT